MVDLNFPPRNHCQGDAIVVTHDCTCKCTLAIPIVVFYMISALIFTISFGDVTIMKVYGILLMASV